MVTMSPERRPLAQSIDAMESGVRTVADMLGVRADNVTLFRLLLMLTPEMQAAFEREVRRHGLNEIEFRTLVILFRHDDGRASPSELCSFDTISRANMTRISDVLVARGLVTRAVADNDRRRVVLAITAKGRRLVRTVTPRLVPGLDALLTGIGAREKRQLIATLKRIAGNLDAWNRKPARAPLRPSP